jgi:hypothetical protein
MSKSQRRKGAAGENEACKFLADEFGVVVKRNLDQTRDGGTDIHIGPFRIEVKRRARIAGLYEWLAQADGELPALMLRADGKGWLVVMDFEKWARLARGEM